MKRSTWRPTKDEVVSDFGAVVTSHPLASEVGVQTLSAGGNAVDAAVAVGFCLTVVEPWASSIAGHGQMLVHLAEQQASLALDFSHRAPMAATPEMYRVIGRTQEVNGLFEVENRANVCGYKRGLNNMVPLLLLKERKPFASLGAVGGRRIISCNTQIVLNLVDRQMSLQQAIASPRVDASEAVTLADLRLDSECLEGLGRMGHEVEVVEESPSLDSGFAKPLGVMIDPATNRIRTGVDVFRISEARGI